MFIKRQLNAENLRILQNVKLGKEPLAPVSEMPSVCSSFPSSQETSLSSFWWEGRILPRKSCCLYVNLCFSSCQLAACSTFSQYDFLRSYHSDMARLHSGALLRACRGWWLRADGETEEGGEAVQEAGPDSTSQSFTLQTTLWMCLVKHRLRSYRKRNLFLSGSMCNILGKFWLAHSESHAIPEQITMTKGEISLIDHLMELCGAGRILVLSHPDPPSSWLTVMVSLQACGH